MDSNSKLAVGFTYRCRILDQHGNVLSEDTTHNIFTTQGMIYMLGAALGPTAKATAFYAGLFQANYTPVITDTAASFPSSSTESTAYNETSRQTFTPNTITVAQIDNIGLEARFTMNAAITIYGAFLSTAQTKGSTAGVLVSAAKFSTPQSAAAGNVISLQAGCTLVNV